MSAELFLEKKKKNRTDDLRLAPFRADLDTTGISKKCVPVLPWSLKSASNAAHRADDMVRNPLQMRGTLFSHLVPSLDPLSGPEPARARDALTKPAVVGFVA